MWATHKLFKLPGFNCVSLVASPPLEISFYTTSWKPYNKNPGYAPDMCLYMCARMTYSSCACAYVYGLYM